MDEKWEIQSLRWEPERANYEYYVLDNPSISDYDFDHKLRRLEELRAVHPELVTPDSPTQRVGGKVVDGFQKVRHRIPLESLQDMFSMEELGESDQRTREALPEGVEHDVEPKADGLSVVLEYENGLFVRGVTCGDDQVGEDVTENLRIVPSIPLHLPGALPTLIVRGEMFIPKKSFERLNKERELRGESLFVNPRNAAVDFLRQLNSKIVASWGLDIQVFNIQWAEGKTFQTHSGTLEYLWEQHFKVIPHDTCKLTAKAAGRIRAMGEGREVHPSDIDGAVVKANSLAERETLGSTTKSPRWVAAYKYPPEQKPPRVVDTVAQVGRTGVLTPKVAVEPVRLTGTIVTSATLHNQDFIAEKDIRIGDIVLVQKAGKIIPEIVEVLKEKRPEGTQPYHLPEQYPVCGMSVACDEDGAHIRYIGAECPAQRLRHLVHFASRGAMDIEGLSPAVVENPVGAGLVKGPGDLYYLNAEEVAQLERMGKKGAENLVAAIERSKGNDLSRLLFAFGTRQAGQKAGKMLAARFGTPDALMAAPEEELAAVSDIGGIAARSLLQRFQSPQSIHLIDTLREVGVNLESHEEPVGDQLAGKIFVLAGALKRFTRDEVGAAIEAQSGKVSGSISKKAFYVVAGEAAGFKPCRVQKLGIPVLIEEEFPTMLGSRPDTDQL